MRFFFSGITIFLCMVAGFAQSISGTMRGGLSYSLNGNTLTINGEGRMEDFYVTTSIYWWKHRDDIKEIIINNGVTRIGDYSFRDCANLKSITIPESVTAIGKYAFFECKGLDSITFPKSISTIDESAFFECNRLTSIICYHTTPPDGNKAVFNSSTRKNCTVWVPDRCVSEYDKAFLWDGFTIKPLSMRTGNTPISRKVSTSGSGVSSGTGRYFIIVGHHENPSKAEDIGRRLHDKYGYTYEVIKVNDKLYRVSVDHYDNVEKAELELINWKKKPGIPKDAWVWMIK